MILNYQSEKPKFVIFDGLDNTGKSTLISKVKKHFDATINTDLIHFPSNELVKKYFNSEKQIRNQRKEFVDELFLEVEKYYNNKVRSGSIFFIDRFAISTLLFQGDPENIDDEMNSYIDGKYIDFFCKYNISIYEDVLFFIFMNQFPKQDREITEKNKEIFDNKIEFYKKKLLTLYSNIIFDKYSCLFSDNTFDCSFTLDDIDLTQKIREKLIVDKISSYFSLM